MRFYLAGSRKMKHAIDRKFVDMLVLLIHEQNRQLADIIAEEEKLPYHLVRAYVPSTHKVRQMIGAVSQTSSSEEEPSSSLVE